MKQNDFKINIDTRLLIKFLEGSRKLEIMNIKYFEEKSDIDIIEAILLRVPQSVIPFLYHHHDNIKEYQFDLLFGKKLWDTIYMFYHNYLKLKDGRCYRDLSSVERRTFDEYSFTIHDTTSKDCVEELTKLYKSSI